MFPTINKKETGVNLRRIMDMRGVKPKDIQEYLGFGCVQSVYRWLDGVSMPTVDNLYALSKMLQVPMEEFRRAQAEVEQKKEKPMSQKMLNQNEIFLENEIQSFVSQLIGYKSKYNLYPHSIQCADSYYGIHSCKHWLDGTCDGHLCAESEIPELVMDDNYLL